MYICLLCLVALFGVYPDATLILRNGTVNLEFPYKMFRKSSCKDWLILRLNLLISFFKRSFKSLPGFLFFFFLSHFFLNLLFILLVLVTSRAKTHIHMVYSLVSAILKK